MDIDEEEFRRTYHRVNPQRCWFEKVILARRANCDLSTRFNLGEREGVACDHAEAQLRCQLILQHVRERALFSLRMARLEGPLPHAKEIKVQNGGLLGLREQLDPAADPQSPIRNIDALLADALKQYGEITQLPYDALARAIVKFEIKPRRGNR